MYLSVALILFVTLSWVPVWSWELYQDALQWERTQIELDNAANELALAQQEILNGLQLAQEAIGKLELVHDPLHLCGVWCVAKDKAAEVSIRLAHFTAQQAAQMAWRMAVLRARTRLMAMGKHLARLETPTELPAHKTYCKVCHLATGWSIRAPINSLLHAKSHVEHGWRVGTQITVKEERKRWKYWLHPIERE